MFVFQGLVTAGPLGVNRVRELSCPVGASETHPIVLSRRGSKVQVRPAHAALMVCGGRLHGASVAAMGERTDGRPRRRHGQCHGAECEEGDRGTTHRAEAGATSATPLFCAARSGWCGGAGEVGTRSSTLLGAEGNLETVGHEPINVVQGSFIIRCPLLRRLQPCGLPRRSSAC